MPDLLCPLCPTGGTAGGDAHRLRAQRRRPTLSALPITRPRSMRSAAVVLAALAASAQAGVDFIGAGDAFAPPANDYGVTQVTRGDDVYLTTESNVTFTSLFQESADLNFFIGGSKVFTEAGISESATFSFGAGLMPFSFGGSNGKEVLNGQNFAQYAGGEEVTFAHADSDTFDFLLGYNDNFAGIGDKDFDDFIVGVDVSPTPASTVPVPEPGMAALFGLGLIGVGLARMRKGARKRKE